MKLLLSILILVLVFTMIIFDCNQAMAQGQVRDTLTIYMRPWASMVVDSISCNRDEPEQIGPFIKIIKSDTLIITDTSIHFIKVGDKTYRVKAGLEYVKTREDIFADSLIKSWHLGESRGWVISSEQIARWADTVVGSWAMPQWDLRDSAYADTCTSVKLVKAFAHGVLLIPGCDSFTDPENGITVSAKEIRKWITVAHLGDYPVKWTPGYYFFGQDKEWHDIKDIEKVHRNAGRIPSCKKTTKYSAKPKKNIPRSFVGNIGAWPVTSVRGDTGTIKVKHQTTPPNSKN